VGGVGGFAAEALCRAGVGAISLFDADTISRSNLNRQIIALQSTIGKEKTAVMAERMRDINPDILVSPHAVFYDAATAEEFPLSAYDYILDAIDTVSSKLLLIERAAAAGVPIISAMGAGNKLDPSRFEVADISKTSVCPLARVMRRELKQRGIFHLKVVYSSEPPLTPHTEPTDLRRPTPGSLSFVPGAAGLCLAGAVVRDLIARSADAPQK
ncbi:MAG: tRNA threonylcarbamoyladenosine dehydratase, partial [Pygmaiobacter sp.]